MAESVTVPRPAMRAVYYDRQGRSLNFWQWLPLRMSDFPCGYWRVRLNTVRDYQVSTVWIGFDASGLTDGTFIFETRITGPNMKRFYKADSEMAAVRFHYTALYGLLLATGIPVHEVRGWLELTGWNRRPAVEAG